MPNLTATGEAPKSTLIQLADLTNARRDLEREESALVRRARVEGFSWEAIAGALGVTRQAAHKKYGKR